MAAAQVESWFEHLRQQIGLTVDQTLLAASPDDPRRSTPFEAQPQSSGLTLGEAYRRYVEDPTRAWSASTRQAYETTRSLAEATFGVTTPIKDISRLRARELVEVLRFLPRNAAKLFPKLSLMEAADRARADSSIERISAANANAYLGNFSTFMNCAVDEEIISRNPARGLRLPDKVALRDKRHPFSPKQLKLIFNAPLYTGCVDGDHGWLSKGTELPQNARYWVPLLALHTGARLNEICQLDVTDVRTIDGVPCICVTRSSLVGSTDKMLKTVVSERVIPIHSTMLDLGLASYAERAQREGHTKLFHDINPGSQPF